MGLKRVVVTGLGALTPIGNSKDAYWKALEQGVSGSNMITHFDAELFRTRFACELKGFNAADHFDRKEMRKLDPFAQYAIVASREAIRDAALNSDSVDPYRVGVIWGSGIGGLFTFQEQILQFARDNMVPRFNPFFVPKMIVDIVPGHISIEHGFKGMNFATVSACASATNALIDAFHYIQLGKADAIVSGGSEAAINYAGVGGFSGMKALSPNNDEFETASRPFDKTRDGFVLGEGAASLILEEYEHAKARGAKIYAEVKGTGMTADAHHITAPHPEGEGAAGVMKLALQDAGLQPSDIDYINVHGTSTPLGDIAESKAILEVFGKDAYDLNISSTKSMTGHLLGAAGGVEALAALFAINEGIIPPTINFNVPDPDIDQDLNFTFNKAQKRDVKAALSNTFGFGGHNASIIFTALND